MDILGIGECMIELDADTSMVASTTFRRQVGGDVYNTLVAASRLGSPAGFFTRLSMDGFGHVLLRHFEENGIDTRCVQTTSEGTNGLYFASINEKGEHEFVYYRKQSAASQMAPAMLTPGLIAQAQIVYVSGITQAISPTARQTVLKAVQLAKQQGKLVAFDTNYRPALWKHRNEAMDAMVEVLPYVDVLLPSEADMRTLFDFQDVPHMMEYFRLKEIPIVALKLGKDGAALGFRHHVEYISPVHVPHIQDTIGAGDAFNGGFLHGLLQKRSLLECARLGTIVSACSLSESGPIAGLPFWPKVEQLLQKDTLPGTMSETGV